MSCWCLMSYSTPMWHLSGWGDPVHPVSSHILPLSGINSSYLQQIWEAFLLLRQLRVHIHSGLSKVNGAQYTATAKMYLCYYKLVLMSGVHHVAEWEGQLVKFYCCFSIHFITHSIIFQKVNFNSISMDTSSTHYTTWMLLPRNLGEVTVGLVCDTQWRTKITLPNYHFTCQEWLIIRPSVAGP